MKTTLMFLCLVCILFLASSASAACPRHVFQSKASYFSNDQALPSGACGYGALALGFNDGYLAGAAPSIYNNGLNCGACYKIRCKHQGICNKQGTVVFVSDLSTGNGTDFVLSRKAFMAMANKGKDQDVVKLGIADIEYERVPCEYKKNLAIRVEESTKNPYYFAVKFLYVGGQTQIVTVEVAQVTKEPTWIPMSHDHGAVWSMSNVPAGPLQFEFRVAAGFEASMHGVKRLLPANWANGGIYDLGIQFTDIACA